MLAFSAFVDTLRLAADEGDRSRPIHCTWSVLSHNMRAARASCGMEVLPTTELDDPRRYDYVVVVGGLLDASPLADAQLDYLRRAAALRIPLVGAHRQLPRSPLHEAVIGRGDQFPEKYR